jgi:coenzyme F420-reducing hydrogenase delta subunit/Pyruvate/2-oxoacid:ferredoxin oxidoreductase delta subunit
MPISDNKVIFSGAPRAAGAGEAVGQRAGGSAGRPGRGPWAAAREALSRVDAGLNRLYGSRLNPLYHSGSLVVALLIVLLVTGVYLLVFYRVGAPYESTARITGQVWAGRWIRSLHRFASDAAVVAIVVHALRMLIQGRSWGPRALAWITGGVLLFVFLVCGWTGYVMVWDVQGQVLAVEGARVLDLLPILSEPISRTFVGERPLPAAFFFTNLFLHVALPIGLALLLLLHVARVARPKLLPTRALGWGVVGLLLAVSVIWPVGMAPEADLLRLPERAPYDVFFAFWLPASRLLAPGLVWMAGGVLALGFLLVPLLARPAAALRPPRSVVDERLCTGCEQCARDCPYEAISMVERADERAGLVARVDADLCVSCGICAGSCAPMVVGPPGRTGREQLAAVKRLVAERTPGARDVVVVGCAYGAGGVAALDTFDGAVVLPVLCAGSLHTSVVEYLVRSGAGGVMVVSCPPGDCRNREGAKWVEARMYHEREAELKARVDRRRVRLVAAAAAERSLVQHELRAFRASLAEIASYPEDEVDILALCERPSGEAS